MSVNSQFVKVPTANDLDIVSDLKFSKTLNQFLVSSWDNRLQLYDCSYVDLPIRLNQFKCQVPILSIEYLAGNTAYGGSLDGSIYQVDYENARLSRENFVISHDSSQIDKGINNLNSLNNLLIASSFDKLLYVIDPRLSRPVFHDKLSKKVLKMDTTSKYLTLGMSERTIEIYDHRNWKSPIQTRESGLKLQINDLKTFPNQEDGFAVASIDGRVSIEYYDPSDSVQAQKFAFKCHRQFNKLTQTDTVYPINSILFNKSDNSLVTSGSDGIINIWDWQKRKKLKQFNRFQYNDGQAESVVKLDMNHDQSVLAVATSDDGFRNAKDLSYNSSLPQYPSHIYLKPLTEAL